MKESAQDSVRARSAKENLRLVVLTGDTRATADAVAKAVGIEEVEAGGDTPTRRKPLRLRRASL